MTDELYQRHKALELKAAQINGRLVSYNAKRKAAIDALKAQGFDTSDLNALAKELESKYNTALANFEEALTKAEAQANEIATKLGALQL